MQPHHDGFIDSEFRSQEDLNYHNTHNMHQGHHHFTLPFDFANIQVSVWFALIPCTIFVWQNLSVLKMDHVEEFVFFKKNMGLRRLKYMQYLTYMLLVGYLIFAAMNYKHLSMKVWQHFEGICVYTMMCIMMTSLSEYSRSKLKDFEVMLQQRKDLLKKRK